MLAHTVVVCVSGNFPEVCLRCRKERGFGHPCVSYATQQEVSFPDDRAHDIEPTAALTANALRLLGIPSELRFASVKNVHMIIDATVARLCDS